MMRTGRRLLATAQVRSSRQRRLSSNPGQSLVDRGPPDRSGAATATHFFLAAGLAAAAGFASAVSVLALAFAGAVALACFWVFAFWFAFGDLSPMMFSFLWI